MAAIYCKEYDNKDRLIFAEKKYLDEPERTKKYKYYYNNSGFCYRLDLLNYLDEIISYDLIIKDSLGRTTQTTSFCSDGTAIESDEYSYWGNTNYISSFINNYFPKNILYEWKRFYNDSWCEIRYESYYNGVLIGYDISTYDKKNRMAKIEYYTATGTLEGSCVFTYEDKALLQIERGVYLDEAGVTIDMWIIETEYYDTQDLSAGSFSLGNRRGEAQQQVFNQNRLAAIREKHYKKKGIILPQGSEDKNMD